MRTHQHTTPQRTPPLLEMRQTASASENNKQQVLRSDKRVLSEDLVKWIFYTFFFLNRQEMSSKIAAVGTDQLCIWAAYEENRRQLAEQVQRKHAHVIFTACKALFEFACRPITNPNFNLKWFLPPPSISHGKSIKTHWENALLMTGTQFR